MVGRRMKKPSPNQCRDLWKHFMRLTTREPLCLVTISLNETKQILDWPAVQLRIKEHPDFLQYFYECPEDVTWTECDLNDVSETRIPFDVLDTNEAETVFKNHVNALQQEEKRLEWKHQFKQLLEDTGYVTPGKLLSEVRVLFMGRECFEALTEQDCQNIYDQHQKEIVEKAKQNFQNDMAAIVATHLPEKDDGDKNEITEKISHSEGVKFIEATLAFNEQQDECTTYDILSLK
uniref:FF domain-containing protein n=1 Tax=Timema tahoe TaxID=61484 RepID=A0A7R9FGE3_9NEOP|nr:unnamed protein product [Timema tahoe]